MRSTRVRIHLLANVFFLPFQITSEKHLYIYIKKNEINNQKVANKVKVRVDVGRALVDIHLIILIKIYTQ